MFLLLLRVVITGKLTFIFLAWNLFLAYTPYFVANWLRGHKEIFEKKLLLAIVLLVWVLLMPNSFYILTDLYHLEDMHSTMRWFDLTLILSFAWNGVVCGILAMRIMEELLGNYTGKAVSIIFLSLVTWLNALGIYIGRDLRYNSWSVLTHPFRLVREILIMAINPFDYMYVWGMVCLFATFIGILYCTVRLIGKGGNEFFS
jgi:uncharacterized membrane protein